VGAILQAVEVERASLSGASGGGEEGCGGDAEAVLIDYA